MPELKKENGRGKTHPEGHQAVVGVEFPQAHQALDSQAYPCEHRKQQTPGKDDCGYGKNELQGIQPGGPFVRISLLTLTSLCLSGYLKLTIPNQC